MEANESGLGMGLSRLLIPAQTTNEIEALIASRMEIAKRRAEEGKCTDLYRSYFDAPKDHKGSSLWVRMREDGTIVTTIS